MRLFVSVAVLSLTLAGSALAQATPEQTTAQPTADQPAPTNMAPVAVGTDGGKDAKKKDGVVCHKETVTGSQFPVKVCTTADQRQSQRRMAQRAQESMQGPAPVIPN